MSYEKQEIPGLAAGYGGDDAYLVSVLDCGIYSLKEAYVLAVKVEDNEAVHLSQLVYDLGTNAGEALLQLSDALSDASAIHLHSVHTVGHAPQRSRNSNCY